MITCDFCKEEIKEGDKKKSFGKKEESSEKNVFHIKCFRKFKKTIKKGLWG